MAVEKWTAGSGVGLTWSVALNSSDTWSLANGKAVLSTVTDITNGTALDIFADFSISLAGVVTAAPNYIGVYLYPLNQDGTSYGDNQFTAGTGSSLTPGNNYYRGSIVVNSTGAAALTGSLTGIVLPPGSFRFLMQNNAGVTLSSSAGTNTVKYRTYNRSVA